VDDFHRRLAQIGFAAGDDLGLVLAGGYAIAQYDLTNRPSQDVDFATASALPLPKITDRLAQAYRAAGFSVVLIESTPRMARLEVRAAGQVCEIDLLKEAIGPPAMLSVGPVLAIDDAIGLKMRALHERTTHRDFIDVCAAAAAGYTQGDLERLGRRHTPDFSLLELADRLSGAVDLNDRGFAAYGLGAAAISNLRAWAAAWEIDLRSRSATEPGPAQQLGELNWDAYLDE
jgi:Nucleotidyl transferase AbiEii toxin, Type IV TA system